MPDVVELAAAIEAACRAGAGEIAEALTRTFGTSIQLAVGESSAFDVRQLPIELQGPGLAVGIVIGDQLLLVGFPALGGLLPDWYTAPDATGTSKLATLAQEMGLLMLPAEIMADDARTVPMDNLAAAIQRGKPAGSAIRLTLRMTSGDGRQAALHAIWPLTAPAGVWAIPTMGPSPNAGRPAATTAARPTATPARPAPVQPPAPARIMQLEELPSYTRSLLKIPVTVIVSLANKRATLDRVVDLGPGSIIHFNKSCEEMLSLEVGGQLVAEGEPVKVGDKFGIRITSVVIPPERFRNVGRTS